MTDMQSLRSRILAAMDSTGMSAVEFSVAACGYARFVPFIRGFRDNYLKPEDAALVEAELLKHEGTP